MAVIEEKHGKNKEGIKEKTTAESLNLSENHSDTGESYETFSDWLARQIGNTGKNIVILNFPDEMERTLPPENPCGKCERISDKCANFPLPDNRMDLYRLFRLFPTNVPEIKTWHCKACLKSCFVRETLYIISGQDSKRISWVTERVKCNSCGSEWRRKEYDMEKTETLYLAKIATIKPEKIETIPREQDSPCSCDGKRKISIKTESVPAAVIPIRIRQNKGVKW